MSRSLPPRPNLDFVKHEAKHLLRAFRRGENPDHAVSRRLDSHGTQSPAAATLVEVQHALALEYGYSGWTELKTYIESLTPVLQRIRPVLRVGSHAQALDHYVDWLGFALDWEWREAPGQPVIAALSRDDCAFMINEHPQTPGPTSLHLDVRNLNALVDEWNDKRPGSAEVRIAPPYEFEDVPITDPWGNVLVFEGKDEAAETRKREAIRPRMRKYVESRLEAGHELPTPEEVRDAVGPPLGTAIEVLNEFPEYGRVFDARSR